MLHRLVFNLAAVWFGFSLKTAAGESGESETNWNTVGQKRHNNVLKDTKKLWVCLFHISKTLAAFLIKNIDYSSFM